MDTKRIFYYGLYGGLIGLILSPIPFGVVFNGLMIGAGPGTVKGGVISGIIAAILTCITVLPLISLYIFHWPAVLWIGVLILAGLYIICGTLVGSIISAASDSVEVRESQEIWYE